MASDSESWVESDENKDSEEDSEDEKCKTLEDLEREVNADRGNMVMNLTVKTKGKGGKSKPLGSLVNKNQGGQKINVLGKNKTISRL